MTGYDRPETETLPDAAVGVPLIVTPPGAVIVYDFRKSNFSQVVDRDRECSACDSLWPKSEHHDAEVVAGIRKGGKRERKREAAIRNPSTLRS